MFISFYLIFFHSIFCQDNGDKLIFAMIHFRHGARASTFDGKIDFMNEYWEHPGELTSVGERMHYILGLRNRKRYINDSKLLSENYNSNELKVISTGFSRTIVSALSHLQGLYPPNHKLGEILNEYQLNNSTPPINIDEELEIEINKLNKDALPDSLSLIPIDIKNSSNFITFFVRNNCRGAQKLYNTSNNENMNSIEKEFNEKYGSYMNEFKFKNKSKEYKYSYISIARLCDTYIACYTDGRNMSDFRDTGINSNQLNDLYNLCLNAIKTYFSEFNMREDDLFYLEGTEIMELLISNVKRSIEADINNNSDSSYPKMLIYSGHDITVSKQIFFLLKAFDLNFSLYEMPTYATQIAFEVTRQNKDKTENRKYSDYLVSYYFKDELQLNETADKFIKKIEDHIWPNEKINSFCEYGTSNQLGDNIPKKDVTNYKTPFLIFACLFSASVVANLVFLGIILRKSNNKKTHMKTSSFAEIKNS